MDQSEQAKLRKALDGFANSVAECCEGGALVQTLASLATRSSSLTQILESTCYADATERGHAQFAVGVAQAMPNDLLRKAAEAGCSRLKERFQARMNDSFSSLRAFLGVIAGFTQETGCKPEQQPTPGGDAEVEAANARVQDLLERLQPLQRKLVALHEEEASILSSAPQTHIGGQDAAELTQMMACRAEVDRLRDALQTFEELKNRLDDQSKHGVCAEVQPGKEHCALTNQTDFLSSAVM
jgi:hypothetical protein